MLLPDLAKFLALEASVAPEGTISHYAKGLREHSLLSLGKRGRNGGVPMTSGDAINLTLACTLQGTRGESIAAAVQRVRVLPVYRLIEIPDDFTRALTSFRARTAGEALDGALDDFRTSTFRLWTGGDAWRISASIDTAGRSVLLSLMKPDTVKAICGATLAFGPGFDEAELVSRPIILNADYFKRIAAALGPP